jgi:hypothetical protein
MRPSKGSAAFLVTPSAALAHSRCWRSRNPSLPLSAIATSAAARPRPDLMDARKQVRVGLRYYVLREGRRPDT